MKQYQCIIVGVDLDPAADMITIERGKNLAEANNAKLYLVHALESLNSFGADYAYPAVSDIQAELSDEHRAQLKAEAAEQGITDEHNLIIEVGIPNNVIIEAANELKADLIIVGSHNKHGLGLLLGSTPDDVLHNAPCDVLAIKLDG